MKSLNPKLKIILFGNLIFCICFLSLQAQEPVFEWANGMGGSGNDMGQSITTDAAGNIYVTGTFRGTVDFDPGAGVTNLKAAGGGDIFVLKLDDSGRFQWARAFGGSEIDEGLGITTDIESNVYVTGYFSDTVDFDPSEAGTYKIESEGGYDIFVQKLNTNGDFQWAKAIGGSESDMGRSITSDAAGNVYVTGTFKVTADFDPGVEVNNLTSAGSLDIFIQKLDTVGNFKWVKAMGGSNFDKGTSITTDDRGDVYVTGNFQGTVDFDPGIGVTNLTSASGTDIFVQKLDANGNFQWVENMGGSGSAEGTSIITDAAGNVYVTGNFQGTVDFDPSVGATNITAAGDADIFVQKLNADGNFKWAMAMGESGYDYGSAITIDAGGNVYITGTFEGIVDFNPDKDSIFNLTSAGVNDIFVQKINTNGNLQWAWAMGGSGNDRGIYIATDAGGNVYVTGYFASTADFDPDEGTTELVSAGEIDIFITKLSQCELDASVNQIGNTYIANAEGMQEYTWLDGKNGKILCETNEFTPVDNGKYILYIENFGCYAFSDTITVNTLGINNDFDRGIQIYPNPTTGNLNLSFEGLQNRLQISVKNIAGKVIQQVSAENTQFVSLVLNGNKGVYFVEIHSEEQFAVVKVVVL